MEKHSLYSILKHFDFENEAKAYGNGHINETFVVEPKYIVQKINTNAKILPKQKFRKDLLM